MNEKPIKETINNAVQKASQSAPAKDWKDIMEKSEVIEQEEAKNLLTSHKYKFISAAASILLVIAVGVGFAVSTSGGSPSSVKTADRKENTKHRPKITTTTVAETTTVPASEVTTTTLSRVTQTTVNNGPCYKSRNASCGNVVQNWSFKPGNTTITNFEHWGYSYGDAYPANGIYVGFSASKTNVINSDVDVYDALGKTSACVSVEVTQAAGTPNSNWAGQTRRGTLCNDSVVGFSYSGYENDVKNWNSTCSTVSPTDLRHGTWPEPNYITKSYDQWAYFAGPTFVPGDYTITIKEVVPGCSGATLAGPVDVTIYP